MPRTSAVECPGCPSLQALTTDALGLVKVVEARGKAGTPKVVDTWRPPDASRGVLTASYADRATSPILAVARKNGSIEFLNPLNGNTLSAFKVGESDFSNYVHEDDPIVALHLLKTKQIELSSRSSVFLMCTEKGKACLRSIAFGDASSDSAHTDCPSTWDVSSAGKVMCSCVPQWMEMNTTRYLEGSLITILNGLTVYRLLMWVSVFVISIWAYRRSHGDSY